MRLGYGDRLHHRAVQPRRDRGGVRLPVHCTDLQQPRDPAKAAAAILLALSSDDPPLRLDLGNDAVDALSGALDQAKAELAAWERVGRSAVFEKLAAFLQGLDTGPEHFGKQIRLSF